ncbi:hypothetical protein R6Q57_009026 [Mikania cordata]
MPPGLASHLPKLLVPCSSNSSCIQTTSILIDGKHVTIDIFKLHTTSEQSDLIHHSELIPDFLCVADDTGRPSKAAPSHFSYSIGPVPLTDDGPKVLGQGDPKRIITPELINPRFPICSFDRIRIKLGNEYLVYVTDWDMALMSTPQIEILCSFPAIRSGVSSAPELRQVLHHDRGARYLLRLEWKGRRKKGLCLRWGNRYGSANKCPDDTKQGRTNDSLPSLEDKTFK